MIFRRTSAVALLCLFVGAGLQAGPPSSPPDRPADPGDGRPEWAGPPGYAGPLGYAGPPEAVPGWHPGKGRKMDPKFSVDYDLKSDVKVHVHIEGPDGYPVHDVEIASGTTHGKAGSHKVPVWDGKDHRGHDAPAGPYHVITAIEYPDGRRDVKHSRFDK